MVSVRSEPRCYGTLWVQNLDWPAPDGIAPLIQSTFVRVGPEATPALARAMGLDDPLEVRQRIASSRRCYGAVVENNLAAYGWVTFDEEHIGEMGLRIRLVPGEAYIWDCATALPYRRRGLYTALLAHIVAELRAEALCRVWIGADGDNVASQRGIARAGFRPAVDLLATRAVATRPFWVRGRPGVPKQVVTDARLALIGDRSRG
jgi:GNAT superfamily N-acetyltransferase